MRCELCGHREVPESGEMADDIALISRVDERESTPLSQVSRGPVDNRLPRLEESAHAHAMSLIDGCPECVLNTEAPYLVGRLTAAWRCMYRCSDCGNAWTTDWRD